MPFVEIPPNSVYTRSVPRVRPLPQPFRPQSVPIPKKIAFVPN